MGGSRRNRIVKIGDYCDVIVDPNDDHATVTSKAVRLLALEPEMCTLYHSSGVKVVDQDIVDDGQRYPWTILERHMLEAVLSNLDCFVKR